MKPVAFSIFPLSLLIVVARGMNVGVAIQHASAWILALTCFVGGLLLGILMGPVWNRKRSADAKRIAFATKQTAPASSLKPFISYSHADKSFAKRLENALGRHGVSCWLDEKSLKAGDDIHDAVATAIADFDKFLICCSKSSLKSWWVDNELGTAFLKEEDMTKKEGRVVRIVIPLNLDGTLFEDTWNSGYKAQLRRRLAVDFTNWQDEKDFEDRVGKIMLALLTDADPTQHVTSR